MEISFMKCHEKGPPVNIVFFCLESSQNSAVSFYLIRIYQVYFSQLDQFAHEVTVIEKLKCLPQLNSLLVTSNEEKRKNGDRKICGTQTNQKH